MMQGRQQRAGQQGAAALAAVAIVAALGAGGAGWYAWAQSGELAKTRRELASTTASLDKAKGDLAAMKKEAERVAAEVKLVVEENNKLRSEVHSAQAFLEAEKAHSARLRVELQMARDQLALAARGRRPAALDAPPMPMTIQRPMVIRAAPGGGAIGAASPAPAPAQGYPAPQAPGR